MKIVRNKLTLTALTLIAMSFTIQAAMYRWEDESGKVHYTQHPPPRGEVKVIPPPLKAASTADEDSKRFKALDKQIEENKKLKREHDQKAQESKTKKTILQANCERARLKEQSLRKSNKYRDEMGNLTTLTPEGKKAALKNTEAEIQIFCQ